VSTRLGTTAFSVECCSLQVSHRSVTSRSRTNVLQTTVWMPWRQALGGVSRVGH